MKIPLSFYQQDDVVGLAQKLLGKQLLTNIDGVLTAGIISETEAYAGITDRASHAYKGRRTDRTEIMYHDGGVAYVYLCYGIHSLFNIVTNLSGIPHAILIRGIRPTKGKEKMLQRSGKATMDPGFGNGPGKVSKILGINTADTGEDLTGNRIWLEDSNVEIPEEMVIITPRIGIDYAGADAGLPYRFVLK